MNLTQIQNTILAWQISVGIAIVISSVITFGLLYLVIRAGVRDGMRDAMREARPNRKYTGDHLPNIGAD